VSKNENLVLETVPWRNKWSKSDLRDLVLKSAHATV